jgi:hypothetical protein
VLLCLPYATVVLLARLEGFDRSLEEASRDLGQGPFATFRRITLPSSCPPSWRACSLLRRVLRRVPARLLPVGLDATLPLHIWGSLRFPAKLPSTLALGTCCSRLHRRRGLRRMAPRRSPSGQGGAPAVIRSCRTRRRWRWVRLPRAVHCAQGAQGADLRGRTHARPLSPRFSPRRRPRFRAGRLPPRDDLRLERHAPDRPRADRQQLDLLHVNAAYEPLVVFDNDFAVSPWLAESFAPSEDGRAWTFTLRGA